MPKHARTAVLVLWVPFLILASPAVAVDGVVELNDAAAMAGGITSGDAAGYPVTIDQGGSYRLTGDLFVTGTNTTIIEITADDVTLDLNGFTVKCLFVFNPCAGNGTGVGIDASGATNVSVRNGTVRGMASTAIRLGDGGFVARVRALANGDGIEVFDGVIEDCQATSNLGFGLSATDTVVRDNHVRFNSIGIKCGSGTPVGCRLTRNVLTRNTGDLDGASLSFGDNMFCDVNGTGCILF